jgi:hypothetical protein
MRSIKTLREDTDGIFPLLIGIAIAGLASWFGFEWLTGGTNPWEAFKVIIIASLVFVVGVIALMGKFITIPKPYGLIIGLGCIGGSIYYIWAGL